jgi:hypothetical protein
MSNQEKIQSFIQYSRESEIVARQYLERCNWDVDRAKELFWRTVILVCDLED